MFDNSSSKVCASGAADKARVWQRIGKGNADSLVQMYKEEMWMSDILCS